MFRVQPPLLTFELGIYICLKSNYTSFKVPNIFKNSRNCWRFIRRNSVRRIRTNNKFFYASSPYFTYGDPWREQSSFIAKVSVWISTHRGYFQHAWWIQLLRSLKVLWLFYRTSLTFERNKNGSSILYSGYWYQSTLAFVLRWRFRIRPMCFITKMDFTLRIARGCILVNIDR